MVNPPRFEGDSAIDLLERMSCMQENRPEKGIPAHRYPLWSCDTKASLPSHSVDPSEEDSGRTSQTSDPQKVPLLTHETYGQEQSYQKYESEYCYEFMFRTEDTCVPRDVEMSVRSEGVRVNLAKVTETSNTASVQKQKQKQRDEELKEEQHRKKQSQTEHLVAIDPCMGKYEHDMPNTEVTLPREQNIQTMTIPAELRKKLGQTHFCFPLPHDANASHAQVHYSEADGIISISVPKVVRMLELQFN